MGKQTTHPKQLKLTDSLPIASPEKASLTQSFEPKVAHGGTRSIGKRKTSRPFNTTAPQHLVLKSSRARGSYNLAHRRNRARLQSMAYRYAHRYGVKLYQYQNHGTELHLLVRARDRKKFADFLRVFCGRSVCAITGAKKGVKCLARTAEENIQSNQAGYKRKFWDALTFSKLINWGASFAQVRSQMKNTETITETTTVTCNERRDQSISPKVDDKFHPS
jgi:hypothetical protein